MLSVNLGCSLGPLREFPTRVSIFSANSAQQLGKSGKFMSDILFKNEKLLERVNEKFREFDINYQVQCTSYHSSTEPDTKSNIYALRLIDTNSIDVSLLDVGFGISQVLPVITQCLLSRNQTIIIEQPELHLHPKLQTELGDLFIDSASAKGNNNTLIVETHSEHLMLRIMRRIRESKIKPEDVSVLFVESLGDKSMIHEMELNSMGEFIKAWPGGFFEEELDELW